MQGFAFARADHALPIVDLKQCAVGSTTDEGAIVFQKSILFPFQRGPEVRAAIVVEMQLLHPLLVQRVVMQRNKEVLYNNHCYCQKQKQQQNKRKL